MNNRWVREEIKWKIRKYFEPNHSEKKIILEFVDVTKAVLMGKFVGFKAYIRKEWSPN